MIRLARVVLAPCLLAGCVGLVEEAGPPSAPIDDRTRTEAVAPDAEPVTGLQGMRLVDPDALDRSFERGLASWYGARHQGRPTASGERFDMNALSAAHPSLPLGSTVLVTNLASGRSVAVRINDRFPPRAGYVIDLSRRAAAAIGLRRGSGHAPVALLPIES